jgi:hypothetical protein
MSDMLWRDVNWRGCKIKVIVHFCKSTMPLRNWGGMLIKLGTFLDLWNWWRLSSQIHAQICLSLIEDFWYPSCWKLVDPRVHVDLVVKINITASATNQISVICLWPDTLLIAWHFNDFCKFEWEHQYKQTRTYCDLSYASELSTCFTTGTYKWIHNCVRALCEQEWHTWLSYKNTMWCKENGVENVSEH